MSKPCPRCALHRGYLYGAGFSMSCANCGGIGIVNDDGSPIIIPIEAITAGCEVLYERIAEAHEPEYTMLVARMYVAMKEKDKTESS